MNCHQVRRPSHPQTHRGSAREERGRQSWAEMDLAKNLVFVHQISIWPKIYQEDRILCGMVTMETSSEMSSWNPGSPPRRVNLLLQVVLSSWNYPRSCRGTPLDKVAFVCQGNHSRLTHDNSSLFMPTHVFPCFLGAPNLSWVSQWIAWNLPLISTNYCPWFFYDPGQVRMSHVNKEFVWI